MNIKLPHLSKKDKRLYGMPSSGFGLSLGILHAYLFEEIAARS
jgi:hypothetical protein